MSKGNFDFYSQYKKKWILPLVFTVILIATLVACILFKFKYKCEFAYDISLSIFTGSLVFFLTQLLLYLNKLPKIKMQMDRTVLSTSVYKLTNIKERLEKINTFELEETYNELKNLLRDSYNLLHNNEKALSRTSKILAKRIDYSLWAYFCLANHELDKINHEDFLKDSETYIKIGVLSLKYSQIKDYLYEKICTLHNQISELYKDYDLFYQNEKQKIVDEIF